MTDLAALGLSVRSDGVVVASTKLEEFKGKSDQAARGADNLGKKSDALQTVLKRLAVVAGGALGGLASGAFFMSAVREAETFETTMFRVQAVIRATGGVAGRSADQLREQARGLALDTLESTEGILRAQQTLLTFRNVQGDVFDRAIVAAADMSAALGGDLNSSTMQLAKALENPVQGLTALTRSGTVFTEAQKEMVKAMVEAGDTAGAQAFILSELEAQYGGTARAAAQGLAGAQDTLSQRVQELKLALSDQLGLLSLAVAANNNLASAVLYVTENLPALIDGLRIVGAIVVGLASTQIPALLTALAAKTAGLSAAAIAAGALSGALRVLGAAVAFAGGPLGLLLGILGGAAAAMLLLRDNTATTTPIMDDAKDAVDRINSVLANSSEVALPEAARATLNLTNENIKLAKSAYAAAEAELAKAKAAAQAAANQVGAEGLFTGTGMGTSNSISQHEAAIGRLTRAQSDLLIQQEGLTARINEGQLALSGASEAMTENQRRAIDLTVTMDDLKGSIAGGSGGGGGIAAAVGEVDTAIQQVNTSGEKWANSMAGHFDGLITGGKDFSGVLMSIARQLESSAWQSLFSGNLFGGGGGGLFSGIGSFFSGFFDQGGMIPAGGVGIVGERGPEFVRGPAHVTSRADTARMMQGNNGGGQVVIKLDLSRDVEARIMRNTSGQAVQIVSSALGANRQALPGQIDTINNRGE